MTIDAVHRRHRCGRRLSAPGPDAYQNFDEHNDGRTKVCRTQTTLTGKGSVRRARRGQGSTSHRMDQIMAGELIRERIAILGANVVDEETARDGNLIISGSPDVVRAFCSAIVELFSQAGEVP